MKGIRRVFIFSRILLGGKGYILCSDGTSKTRTTKRSPHIDALRLRDLRPATAKTGKLMITMVPAGGKTGLGRVRVSRLPSTYILILPVSSVTPSCQDRTKTRKMHMVISFLRWFGCKVAFFWLFSLLSLSGSCRYGSIHL